MRNAADLVSMTEMLDLYRKEHRQREVRNAGWERSDADYRLDDHSLRQLLATARQVCLESRQAYPAAATELDGILGDIDERLARLS